MGFLIWNLKKGAHSAGVTSRDNTNNTQIPIARVMNSWCLCLVPSHKLDLSLSIYCFQPLT